jgi:hypothetical protein
MAPLKESGARIAGHGVEESSLALTFLRLDQRSDVTAGSVEAGNFSYRDEKDPQSRMRG